ncbi:MAG: LL-diaminopimelate aminotransferase [Candidatus Firestonebacteria bacterium]|nr:LL-diaminopimelate aminotransferase [Candidatus Firestonebacteria bacterium]
MNFTQPDRLRVLPPYLFVEIDRKKKEAIASGVDVIDLGVGDPDLPTPAPILQALKQAADDPANHVYPFGRGSKAFLQAVSRWFERRFNGGLDAGSEIVCLIGSKEGIGHAPLALVNPGDVVLIPEPGYPAYLAGTVFAGAEPVFLPLLAKNGYKPDLKNLPVDVLRRAKVLFLNYPNNPTGACVDLAYFEEVVAWCRRHEIILAHDMAYSELYYGSTPPPSVLQVKGAKEVAIEFHSFSKTFSMTGWRLGFAAGRKELVDSLALLKGNLDSGTVSAVQVAGIAALDAAETLVPPIVQVYRTRRDLFVKGLQQAGFAATAPEAALYVWCPVPAGMNSTTFATRLLEEAHVVATPGMGFGPSGEGFVRFSLTSPEARLAEAVRRMQAIR